MPGRVDRHEEDRQEEDRQETSHGGGRWEEGKKIPGPIALHCLHAAHSPKRRSGEIGDVGPPTRSAGGFHDLCRGLDREAPWVDRDTNGGVSYGKRAVLDVLIGHRRTSGCSNPKIAPRLKRLLCRNRFSVSR